MRARRSALGPPATRRPDWPCREGAAGRPGAVSRRRRAPQDTTCTPVRRAARTFAARRIQSEESNIIVGRCNALPFQQAPRAMIVPADALIVTGCLQGRIAGQTVAGLQT